MKIHYLQHVPFEDIGMMRSILISGGHSLTCTKFFKPHDIPSVHDFDFLIVMGGPMGVNNESAYPWLHQEKKLIEAAIRHQKKVLGICLGAQLIAQVLGAGVHANPHREIGWFDIETCQEINKTLLADIFPRKTRVFHWHGDTFHIPEGATRIAKSAACLNQGFVFENRVIGLQFHLESTRQSITDLILNCSDEIDGSEYVQSEQAILSGNDHLPGINHLMCRVLEVLIAHENN